MASVFDVQESGEWRISGEEGYELRIEAIAEMISQRRSENGDWKQQYRVTMPEFSRCRVVALRTYDVMAETWLAHFFGLNAEDPHWRDHIF